MRTNIRSATMTLLAPVLSACASGALPSSSPSPAGQTAAEQSAVIGGATGARPDSARYGYTQADIDFMTMMIEHHAQAIVMSLMAPDRAAHPQVGTLAARILASQRDEIRLMQQWLRDRDLPVPEIAPDGSVTMPDNGPDHAAHDAGEPTDPAAAHPADHGAARAGHDAHASMAGMLTADELARLEASSGPEFDRLFLTFMIRHHQGAVEMVSDLFSTYGAAQDETVFRLASDINVDQITEIRRMQDMLVGVLFES